MSQQTILFVDDEPGFAEALRIKIEAMGFDTAIRRDATSGWRYLDEEIVSVLVTDIMMPPGELFAEFDSSEVGLRFVDKVRSEFPVLPIICLSVIGDQEKINKLKRKRVLYLRKGETPLIKAAELIESKARGYSTH